MSESPIEPLPDDIARLLAREKGAYPVDPDAQRAVLSRVERAIALWGGLGGGGGPAAPPGSPGPGSVAAGVAKKSVVGKMIAVALVAFVGGGVTGGAFVKTTTRLPAITPVAAIAPAASSPASAQAPEPLAPVAASPNAEPSSPPARASTAPKTTAAASTHGDLVREREVLDVARAAIAHGQPQDAIAAMQEHARRWPNGALAEEREVVLIQALVAAGRGPEARARAARFYRTFPRSLLAPAVDAAIGAPLSSP